MDQNLREALAAYAHDAWSGWMNYLLSKSTVNADGSWTVPPTSAERWHRQMSTPYHLLPEDEKKSDRNEADRMLAIMISDDTKQIKGFGGLTIEEMAIMENLVSAWEQYQHLPRCDDSSLQIVCGAVNTIQQALAMRVVAREHPDYWTPQEPSPSAPPDEPPSAP